MEDILESNESSQDKPLKTLTAEINSFKRRFPIKPRNGESPNQDIADIVSVVNTIKAAYQATEAGDRLMNVEKFNKQEDAKQSEEGSAICKSTSKEQNCTEFGEPDSKRAKFHCDKTNTCTDSEFQNKNEEDNKTNDCEPSGCQENGEVVEKKDTNSFQNKIKYVPEIDNSSNVSEINSSRVADIALENEASPKSCDSCQQISVKEKIKKPEEEYSTPVKNQHCSSEDVQRSPFLIGDKIRKSLKGIVEKVKSSPDHKIKSLQGVKQNCFEEKEDENIESPKDSQMQESLSFKPSDRLEEISSKDCDKNNENSGSSHVPEAVLLQSDSTAADIQRNQTKHIPIDSVRLKEKDLAVKSNDDQELLLDFEDDTQMEIASDKEDELLQESCSETDTNIESIVFSEKESKGLHGKRTDLTCKIDVECKDHISTSGNLETNDKTVETPLTTDSELSSLEGIDCTATSSKDNRREDFSNEDKEDDVIFEKETSHKIPPDNNSDRTGNRVNLESNKTNENLVEKELSSADNISENSLEDELKPRSHTDVSLEFETDSITDIAKETKGNSADEDDVIFEGFDEPEVQNNKKSDTKSNSSYSEHISKDESLNGIRAVGAECGVVQNDSEIKVQDTSTEVRDSNKGRSIHKADSDISLIEEDELISIDKSKQNNTESENKENTTSLSKSENSDQKSLISSGHKSKLEQEDAKSGEKLVELEKEKKEDVKDEMVNDDDDDDDVIFEGVIEPKTKNSEKPIKCETNSSKGNQVKELSSSSDQRNQNLSTNNDKNELHTLRNSLDSNNSASKKAESSPASKMSPEEEDDDDVIFEGVDKPDNAKNKESTEISNNSSGVKTQSATKEEANDCNDNSAEISESDMKSATDFIKEVVDENKEAKVDSENMEKKSSVKRPAEASCESSDPKRSRLDEVIDKLGSQIGVEPESIEVSESDDDEESATDTAVEEKSEDTSDNDNEDDETNSECEKVKYVKITEQELEELVRERVTKYLATQRETLIGQLSQKIKDLQSSNDQWKAQVKELQVKVSDVTVLNLKHEKRKAATAALKQITTRSVAVQVDEGKTASILKNTPKTADQSVNMVKSPPPRKPVPESPTPLVTAPPGSNGTIRLPIPQSSLTPPVLAAQMPQLPQPAAIISTANYQTPTVKSLLDTTKQQITSGSLTKTSQATSQGSSASQVQYPQRVVAQTKTGYLAVPQSGQVIVTTAVPVQAKSVALTTQMTSPTGTKTLKVIDLTADEDGRQPKVLTLPAAQSQTLNQLRPVIQSQQPQQFVLNQNGQLIQTSPAGQTAFQLVFNSTTTALRPGSVAVYTTVPQPGTVLQTVPQQAVTNLSTTGSVGTQQLVTQVPGQVAVPGQTILRTPTTSASQITSLLSQTKSTETATPVKSQSNVFEERIRPALRKKLETSTPVSTSTVGTHPAPLPTMPANQRLAGLKLLPPKPSLKISRVSQGIVLSWNMTVNDSHEEIASYQLFAYQESSAPPSFSLWKKVGDVKALPLPMACTLTQFQVGNKYHFAVRAVDTSSRVGQFSDYSSIHLTPLPPSTSGKS